MKDGKNILGIIPARGESKGLPKKNIRLMCGKPLIAWTIEQANASRYLDAVFVSTDSEEIATIARQYGGVIPFMRPAELARDTVPAVDVVLHTIKSLDEKYDYVTLLQPTSPMRSAADIDAGVELCLRRKAPACVSVNETTKSPYWMYSIDNENFLVPLLDQTDFIGCRQLLPRTYVLNGAVYVAELDYLKKYKTFLTSKTMAYVMPRERSLDIDTELDFEICEYMMTRSK